MSGQPPPFPAGPGLFAGNPWLELLVRAPRRHWWSFNIELLLVRALHRTAGRHRLFKVLTVLYVLQALLYANWWHAVGNQVWVDKGFLAAPALYTAQILYIISFAVYYYAWIALPTRSAGALIAERGKHTLPLTAITTLSARQFFTGLLGARTLSYWSVIILFLPAMLASPLLPATAAHRCIGSAFISQLGSTALWLWSLALATVLPFLIGCCCRSLAVALPITYALLVFFAWLWFADYSRVPGWLGVIAITLVTAFVWRTCESMFAAEPERFVS
ncbi:MAG TPA: hypothetical protein PKM88_00675 [bacterium]|nr:hypothetical protein [bacterium]